LTGSTLWLHSRAFNAKQKQILNGYMRRAQLLSYTTYFMTLHNNVPNLWVKEKKKDGGDKKDTWCANPDKIAEATATLDRMILATSPKLIVVNDCATLEVITKDYNSLALCRGSVYIYKDIPCIVVDDILKTFKIHYGAWILINDLKKIRRWMEGTQRNEPRFNYTVCHSRDDIDTAVRFLMDCVFISIDIETTSDFMSCVGYCGLHPDGTIFSYIIPLFNPCKPGNAHWQEAEDEVYAFKSMGQINANKACKIFQNGGYDNAYFIRYNIPASNYFLDPLHLWHCIYTESPKKINFIASIALDFCRYWKDEAKGDTKDKDKTLRVPTTEWGLESYWRYNGLDCHNTLLAAKFILQMIVQPPLDWALRNYNVEFRLTVGPALAMSMRGMKVDKQRQSAKSLKWMMEHKKNLKELRLMADDPDFNPESNPQVASLLYDVLGAPTITFGKFKGKRTVDQSVLKFIKLQHPLFAAYIDKLWEVKKPAANAAKYGGTSLLYRGRFLYCLSAAGTETGRFNGKGHQFWVGTNPQNVPKHARDMMVADPGYVLFEADYSQSDAWFVAFESEDPDYMRNISDDRDTHCVHAEHFFKRAYDDIYQGHLIKSEWVEDPIKGVRQITKRVVHGANYQMAATTLYQTMGHEAVVAAAKALGFADAHSWFASQLIKFCGTMLLAYLQLYKRLPLWFEESVQDAIKSGNTATCAFGRTRLFFGNMASDSAIQRKLSAYFGQGGTAGNINRTLNTVYYDTDLEQRGLMLLTQTHDSITGQVKEEKMTPLLKEFLTIMEQPATIKGRTFTVPVEAEVGYSWGKGMLGFNDNVTINQLKLAEAKWQEKHYGVILNGATL